MVKVRDFLSGVPSCRTRESDLRQPGGTEGLPMPPRTARLPKARAVQQAAACASVRALLRFLNQEEEGRGARVTGADGHPTVPIDWLPDDVETRDRIRVLGQAHRDLAALGLAQDDIRRCGICGRWTVFASRKATVCAETACQRASATQQKQRARAAVNELGRERLRR